MILTHTPHNAETNLPPGRGFTIAATREAFEALSGGLYEDRPQAIVRELATNAVDATVGAGTDVPPPHLQLPTSLDPVFRVRDHGVGMSDDTVQGLYSTYFASTKTRDNDTTGAFGLGSKSPLALVDSFTVTTRQQGEADARQYLVRIENGLPTVVGLGNLPGTDFAPGTEIALTVPSGFIDDFHRAYRRVRPFLAARVTDNRPRGADSGPGGWHWLDVRRRLTEGLWYGYIPEPEGGFYDLTLVQGSVAYRVNTGAFGRWRLDPADKDSRSLEGALEGLLHGERGAARLAIEVPLGTLRPALSRETLSLDEATLERLAGVLRLAVARIGILQRARRLLTSTSDELRLTAHTEWLAKYGRRDAADLRADKERDGKGPRRRRRKTTFDYHRYHLRGDEWDHRQGDLPFEADRQFAIRPDEVALFRRRMKGYLRRGDFETVGLLVYRHEATLARRWKYAGTTAHAAFDTLPERWVADDWPLIRVKPAAKSGNARGSAPAKWYRVLDTTLSYKGVANREELLQTPRQVVFKDHIVRLRESARPSGLVIVDVDDRREERTKAYGQLREASWNYVKALLDAECAAVQATHTRRELVLARAEEVLRKGGRGYYGTYHALLRAFAGDDGWALAPGRVRAALTVAAARLPALEGVELPRDVNAAAVRLVERLTERLTAWYPEVTTLSRWLAKDNAIRAYVVGVEVIGRR